MEKLNSMDEIYAAHAKTVYGFLLARVKDKHLAEELTQETFYRAVKGANTFKGDSSVLSWLCGIAKNLWREEAKRLHRENALDADEDSAPSAESDFFKSAEYLKVIKALHGVKEPKREVLYLRLIGNLSFKEIGEVTGKTETWARVTYYRGKEEVLKEVLKHE